MNKHSTSFFNLGFTEVFDTQLNNNGKLDKIKSHIYDLTKEYLVDHDSNIDLDLKLKIPFKISVDQKFLDKFLREINGDSQMNTIVTSDEVKDKFKLIFDNPIKYQICVFRALLPLNIPKSYPWHQDEGSWYLFNDEYFRNKLMGIMWLSINGSNKSNSINLLEKSHSSKRLYRHSFKKGLGYFNANIGKSLNQFSINQVETKPGEALIFHNLTLHKTSDQLDSNKMIPRYSIDIRYFDEDKILNYNVDLLYKMEKILRKFKIKFHKDGIKY